MMRLAIATAILLWSGIAAADSGYEQSRRAATIGQTLEALRTIDATELAALTREVYLGSRGTCRASFGKPTIRCLLGLGETICAAKSAAARSDCTRIVDVVLTNQLSEDEFIDENTKIRLINEGDDFRAAMRRELMARYALLAAELAISAHLVESSELGRAIDQFCLERTDTHVLTWPRCVAALSWYIGTVEKVSKAR